MSPVDEKNPPLAVIFGLSGPKLTKAEKDFFTAANPLGFILFQRNCENKKQVKKLVADLQNCLGRKAPVLIDQEGGRVQRLKGGDWKDYPAAQSFGRKFARNFAGGKQALEENTIAMANDLAEIGVNVNCAPVMDVFYTDTHKSLGDRAFSKDPEIVAVLGGIVCRLFLERGVIPVIKHMPGLGRAALDSHEALPAIDAEIREMEKTDFRPYKEILTKTFSESLWGMVSHAIYKAYDTEAPASCSRPVIWGAIRRDIGFDGLLLSDDICMDALSLYGEPRYRAEKTLRSGCDVTLHCNGDLEEMKSVITRVTPLSEKAVQRYNRSAAWVVRNLKKTETSVA